MQENKIVKRIPTNLVTKTIITSSAEYEPNKEYTDEDANVYEKYLQAITNVSIEINDDIEKIKALEDNILEQYNKNVELEKKMKQETEKFAKQANTAIEDYNSNAEVKTEEFNTNAKEKTDEFNSNATEKETEISDITDGFDANVEEKTNTFNSNVETKTTEFNNNSNTKTEEFNNNSTEKINAFNSNAEEKIAEYDAHAGSVLTETEDLFNALDTEKISGNELYIEDAKPCRIMNTEIGGMYKQNQTKGLNFFDITGYTDRTVNGINIKVKDDGTLTLNGVCTVKKTFINIFIPEHIIPAGTYTRYMSYAEKIKSFLTLALSYNNTTIPNTSVQPSNQYITSTYNDDITYNQIKLYIPNTDVTFNNIIVDPMIVKGEYTANNAPKYEPYTGGNPSPNPDYPQEIKQVESVVLNACNKNFLNLGTQLNGYANESYKYFNGDDNAIGFYFKTEQLPDNIYISSKNGNRTAVSYYNEIPYKTLPYLERDFSNSKDRTIKVNKNYKYIHIQFSIGITQVTEMQIERGTTKTDYKLSQAKAINIDLKGNKLCAVSDTIKDKLLIDRNGNVALQKNVSLITLKKDNIVSRTVLPNGDILYRTTQSIINSNNIFVLCNYYIGIPNISSRKNETIYCNTSNSNSINIIDNNASITTVDEYKTFVENKQIEVYYALATPEIIDLGQLTELPKTFEGINNIWAETNLGNTEIEIEYVQDVKKLLEKQAEQQNARLDNIEALLSTTETSALLLDNMQTDLESEVK